MCHADPSVLPTASRLTQRAGARLTRARSGPGVAVKVHVARYARYTVFAEHCSAIIGAVTVVRASNLLRLSVPCRCALCRPIGEYVRHEASVSRHRRNAIMPARMESAPAPRSPFRYGCRGARCRRIKDSLYPIYRCVSVVCREHICA
jgi:hypothetical protein